MKYNLHFVAPKACLAIGLVFLKKIASVPDKKIS